MGGVAYSKIKNSSKWNEAPYPLLVITFDMAREERYFAWNSMLSVRHHICLALIQCSLDWDIQNHNQHRHRIHSEPERRGGDCHPGGRVTAALAAIRGTVKNNSDYASSATESGGSPPFYTPSHNEWNEGRKEVVGQTFREQGRGR